MTSKELIALLEKIDPIGTACIRVNDEALHHVLWKEGYYDGPSTYIERDEYDDVTLVFSTEVAKLDFYTFGLSELVEHYGGNREEIYKHIKFIGRDANTPPRNMARINREISDYEGNIDDDT